MVEEPIPSSESKQTPSRHCRGAVLLLPGDTEVRQGGGTSTLDGLQNEQGKKRKRLPKTTQDIPPVTTPLPSSVLLFSGRVGE